MTTDSTGNAVDKISSLKESLPVLEETAVITKQVIETGRVNISKKVEEEQFQVPITLLNEEVQIERIPIDKVVDVAPPAVRYEGDTMIMAVVREEVVVQKKLVLVEEIRVTRLEHEQHTAHHVTLRKEHVTVERESLNDERKSEEEI